MPWYLFLWDTATEEHLAEHEITPDELRKLSAIRIQQAKVAAHRG
jgi:hypothetical protein